MISKMQLRLCNNLTHLLGRRVLEIDGVRISCGYFYFWFRDKFYFHSLNIDEFLPVPTRYMATDYPPLTVNESTFDYIRKFVN